MANNVRYKDIIGRRSLITNHKVTPVNTPVSTAESDMWNKIESSANSLFAYTSAWARQDAASQAVKDAEGHNFVK